MGESEVSSVRRTKEKGKERNVKTWNPSAPSRAQSLPVEEAPPHPPVCHHPLPLALGTGDTKRVPRPPALQGVAQPPLCARHGGRSHPLHHSGMRTRARPGPERGEQHHSLGLELGALPTHPCQQEPHTTCSEWRGRSSGSPFWLRALVSWPAVLLWCCPTAGQCCPAGRAPQGLSQSFWGQPGQSL